MLARSRAARGARGVGVLLLGALVAGLVAGPATAGPRGGEAASATKRYTNTPAGLPGALRTNYVDFSFRYPSGWSRVARKQDPLNFVKVVSNTKKSGIEAENFAVGWFRGGLAAAPALVDQLSADLARGFPAYVRLSEGRARFSRYPAYGMHFSSRVARNGVTTRIWGLIMLVPNPAGGNGATVIMLASSASPVVRQATDVGAHGELPGIVASFRFG